MLKAAASGDMRKFSRYSEFVYGKPNPQIFAYTVDRVRKAGEKYMDSDNVDLKEAVQDLLTNLPVIDAPSDIPELPTLEMIEQVRDATRAELGELLNIPYGEGQLHSNEIKQAFEDALTKVRSQGWKVVIDPNKTDISTNQGEKSVHIPEKRQLTMERLQGLILHEIGTHVARRENGSRAKLQLLSFGLDRYEEGEEGIATMRQETSTEQVINDFSGFDGYFAIGLAKGVDGQPRNFAEVYDILKNYYVVQELAAGQSKDKAEEKAKQKAWNRSVRTFRGSDSATKGACFTKDIIYRQGSIGVWEVVRNNPQEMKRFNIGKYDPANPRHIWVLTELGITEQDLKELEK